MNQSFSKISRTQALDSFKFSKNDCCNINFIKGYFYNDNIEINSQSLIHKTDIPKSAKSVKKLLSRYNISVCVPDDISDKSQVQICINDAQSLQRLYTLQQDNTCCDNCLKHFLTGVFVSSGIMVNPEKRYHLEFRIKNEEKAVHLVEIAENAGFAFKINKRKNDFAVYTKNSTEIEEFLITVGAQTACLEIMGGKVLKDVRNRMNRITNCEAANIAKTAQAGYKYIQAINKLIETEMLYTMSEDIQELAQLKLENPDMSFNELGKICSVPLNKSAVNRRLQKMYAVAQSIEE